MLLHHMCRIVLVAKPEACNCACRRWSLPEWAVYQRRLNYKAWEQDRYANERARMRFAGRTDV